MPCVTITGLYSAVITLFELTLLIQLKLMMFTLSKTTSPITLFSSYVLVCLRYWQDSRKWSSDTWLLVSKHYLRLHTGL